VKKRSVSHVKKNVTTTVPVLPLSTSITSTSRDGKQTLFFLPSPPSLAQQLRRALQIPCLSFHAFRGASFPAPPGGVQAAKCIRLCTSNSSAAGPPIRHCAGPLNLPGLGPTLITTHNFFFCYGYSRVTA
jgi:hypothetical protein